MSKERLARKLRLILVAYGNEDLKVRAWDEACQKFGVLCVKRYPRTPRIGELDREYQKLCDKYSLYVRFGMPFYLEDLSKHILLADEILNETLFLH